MATTITEFIEYLKTLPPDTELSVICGVHSMYSYDTNEVPLEIDENTNFVDFDGNPFVPEGAPYYNKKYLTLGEQ